MSFQRFNFIGCNSTGDINLFDFYYCMKHRHDLWPFHFILFLTSSCTCSVMLLVRVGLFFNGIY